MFDEAYKKLDTDKVALYVDELNKHIDGSLFDALETTILSIEIPFYKGYEFLSIADHTTNPPLQRYAFIKDNPENMIVLDWNFKTILDLNGKAPISLNDENVFEYVRFYFNFVKGRHGRFIICESADNIHWKDEPVLDIKKALNATLEPLTLKEKRSDGVYIIKTYMTLKDTLFKVDVYVEPNGRVTMADHEILIENIPVLDPIFGY